MLIESPQKVHDKTLRGCAGLGSTLLTEALPTRTVPPLQQCALEEMPEANKGGRGRKGYGSFGLSSLQSSTSEKWVMALKPGTSPSAPRPPPAWVPRTSTEPRPAQPRGSSRVPSQTRLTLPGNLHFGSPPNATYVLQDDCPARFAKQRLRQGDFQCFSSCANLRPAG